MEFDPGGGPSRSTSTGGPQHPSDDLMTELLNAEFEDEAGTFRRLSRDEVLMYVNVLAGAGNETTTRLIGWTGKVLAEHPDQRRELVEDPSLIPNAIEEILRYEPPAPHVARYVANEVEHYGQTVPQGSAMLFLVGSANRDDRRYPDGDSSTSTARSAGTSRLATASTTVSARHWRGSRAVSPSRKCSSASRYGTSTYGGRQARPDVDGTRLGDSSCHDPLSLRVGSQDDASRSMGLRPGGIPGSGACNDFEDLRTVD